MEHSSRWADKMLFGFVPTNVVRFRPNKLYRTLWPSGIATTQPSCSVVREVCVPNSLSSLTMPLTYPGALSWKPVEVENASVVVVDVAHRRVRLWPMVVGYLWGIRTEVVVGQAFALVTGLPPLGL